ncbi:MAG: hypothetical protein CMJ82_04080 [Planctomycetaceae bacterium]|nr:hypothetical protein [Planctomycetaceae bacterium]|tara:strand:- start:1695 stop:2744 length:1050 start_codon:yes stop_codon:yes gene_type:complete
MIDKYACPVRIARDQYEYLIVDEFLRTLIDVQSVNYVLETGMIDDLTDTSANSLPNRPSVDPDSLLSKILCANGVLTVCDGKYQLSDRFETALRYRDYLQTKIDFIQLVINDWTQRFASLITEKTEFISNSNLFGVFDYSKALKTTPEALAETGSWVKLTTGLTRYESAIPLDHLDFSKTQRLLDVGGNSGELARQICHRNSHLSATVFDLPGVCDYGRQYLQTLPGGEAVTFIAGDLRAAKLPQGYDTIFFKSVLHDWPDVVVENVLDQAVKIIKKCKGRVFIFERVSNGDLPLGNSCAMLPAISFHDYYRNWQWYVDFFQARGCRIEEMKIIRIDMEFILISIAPGV